MALRRDLEWLLNTRRIAVPPDESLKEVNRSLYVFGLPDFTAYASILPRIRPSWCASCRPRLKLFEPRLANVKIVPLEAQPARTRTLRFRIDGIADDGSGARARFVRHRAGTDQRSIRGRRMRDDLLLYYERELTYMRQIGAQFAEKYPKIAARLVLEPTKCDDPHVERLLEGFAFLAARVHLKIDDEFPEITEALLGIVYPHFIRPLPSMSIVQFHLDPEKGKLSTGCAIPRETLLYSRPVDGVPCKFRTCYDTTLWPIAVTAAAWTSPDRLKPPLRAADASGALRIELTCNAADMEFAKLELDQLRFFLDGESALVHTIYEILCCNLLQIVVRDTTPGSRAPAVTLPPPRFVRSDLKKTRACCPTRGARSSATGCCRSISRFPTSSSSST